MSTVLEPQTAEQTDLVETEITKCDRCKKSLMGLVPSWVAEDLGDSEVQEIVEGIISDSGWANYPSNTFNLLCDECLSIERGQEL